MAKIKSTSETAFKKLIKDFTNTQYSYHSILLRNEETGEIWVLAINKNYNSYNSGEFVKKIGNPYKVFYWNGSEFAADPFLTYRPYNCYDKECIKKITTKPFDEIIVYWSGKHSYHVFQRYGKYVMWYSGKYFSSQSCSFVDHYCLFTCEQKQSIPMLFDLLKKNISKGFKEVNPFYDEKRGILMRRYSVYRGVYENRIVKVNMSLGVDCFEAPVTFKICSSHEEAIQEFKLIELESIKENGQLPVNFYFANSLKYLKKEIAQTLKSKY